MNRIRVAIEIVAANARKSLQEFKQSIVEADGATAKFKAGFTGAVTFVQKNAAAITAAGIAIGGGLYKMADGAGETQAAFSSLNQIAGETIANDVAGWAENGVQAFGLSNRAIFTYSKNLANVADSVGMAEAEMRTFVQTHLKMAADFAAFADTSPDQVMQDLMSAYAGSAEVLQKYGVFANETNIKQALLVATGEKITGTLTAQERVMGVNLLLKQKHTSIDGQWARESGELAGQQAQFRANLTNLSDSIAKGALPMMTQLTSAASTATGAFDSLPGPVKSATGTVGAFTAAGLLLTAGLGRLIPLFARMRTAIVALAVASRAHPILALATTLAAIGATVFAKFNDGANEAKQRVDDLAASIRSLGTPRDALVEMLNSAAADVEPFRRALDAAGVTTAEVAEAALAGGETWEEMGRRLASAAHEAGFGVRDFAALAGVVHDLDETAADAISTADQLARTQSDLDNVTGNTSRSLEQLATATARPMTPSERLAQKQREVAETAAAEGRALTSLERPLQRTERSQRDAADAARDHAESLDELLDAQSRLLGGEIGVRDAQRSATEALREYEEAAANGARSAERLLNLQQQVVDAERGAEAADRAVDDARRAASEADRAVSDARQRDADKSEIELLQEQARQAREGVYDAENRAREADGVIDQARRRVAEEERKASPAELEELRDRATLAQLRAAQAAADYAADLRIANGETLTEIDRTKLLRDALGDLAGALTPSSPLRQGIAGWIDDLNTSITKTEEAVTAATTAKQELWETQKDLITIDLERRGLIPAGSSQPAPAPAAPSTPPVVNNYTSYHLAPKQDAREMYEAQRDYEQMNGRR